MQEAAIYKRPEVILGWWYALKSEGNVYVVGAQIKGGGEHEGYWLEYFDSEMQTGVSDTGDVLHLSPERAKPQHWHEDCTREIVALMETPRHIRRPDDFTNADDCPELRRLLSKRDAQ